MIHKNISFILLFVFAIFFNGMSQNNEVVDRFFWGYTYSKHAPLSFSGVYLSTKPSFYIGFRSGGLFNLDKDFDYEINKNEELVSTKEWIKPTGPNTFEDDYGTGTVVEKKLTDNDEMDNQVILLGGGVTFPLKKPFLWGYAGASFGSVIPYSGYHHQETTTITYSQTKPPHVSTEEEDIWIENQSMKTFYAPELGVFINLGILNLQLGATKYSKQPVNLVWGFGVTL
jgi:hypothetical protein